MGALSTATGVELVVPGYFVCAGILLFAALIAAALGVYRRRNPLYIVFAVACLASAGVAAATASYYLADAIPGAVSAQRWLATTSLVLAGAIVVYIGLYTEARLWPVVAALIAAIAVLIVANHLLPLGVRYSSIASSGRLQLPWGESLFRLDGVAGLWSAAYRLLTGVVAMWVLVRLWRRYRIGRRREALVLGLFLFVLFGASMQGALIDMGKIHTFHFSAFALVGLALLAGAGLVLRMHEQNVRLELATEQIRGRVYRDALTGLPNRIYVNDHLDAFVARPSPSFGAVLTLDLDHFKVINDALSHEVGDELLCEVTARLQAAVPPGAMLVRMGGDQFLAVLGQFTADEDTVRAAIDVLAADVARRLGQPLARGERSLNLFASIGVATFEAPGTSGAEILRRADLALHSAKKRGRNNIQRYVPALKHDAAERYRIGEGLRLAIDAGELSLNYQPLVAADGRVLGAEALMRWRKDDGFVSPARFIPVAEETGLIHSLGEWSLREGCLRLAAWRALTGFDGYISINVSPWQFARPDFVSRLRAIVEASGIEPRRLCLEITESAVLFDVDETIAKLREIRPLGVRIALDDFGTGYSSLALLKDLPLDAIKIDQSFVRSIDERANEHLVRVVVAIGAELGLDVIAEGIETEAERRRVVEMGCTRMQGYLFSHPLAEAEFLRWIAARAPVAAGAAVTSS